MEKKTNLNFFSLSIRNIEIQTLAYSSNLFLPTFLLFISSIFRNYNLTAELGILIGINIIFTQIFSSNTRSLLIAKKRTQSIFTYIIFRISISILIIFTNIFIFKFFNFSNNFILFQVTFMIVLQWVNELILTSFELKKKNKNFYLYLYLTSFFILGVIIDFIFFQNLAFILLVYNILLLSFFLNSFMKIKRRKNNFKDIFFNIIKSSAFFSSFSISFANLIWRICIIIFCGKTLAGIYFASFAVGSLPGTLFNNTFGPTIVKNNINIKKYYNFIIPFFLLIMFLILIYIYYNTDKLFIELPFTQLFATFVSLIGTFFMVKGQYFRQYLIQKTIHKFYVFNVDILYSLLIILIVPILYYFGGEKLIITSFLFSSFFSYILYKFVMFKKIENK